MEIIGTVQTERQAVEALDMLVVGTLVVTEAARQLSLYFEREGLQAKGWIIEHRDERAYNAYKMALSRWRAAHLTAEEREAATKGKGKGGGKKGKKGKKGKESDVPAAPSAVNIAGEEIRRDMEGVLNTLTTPELQAIVERGQALLAARARRQDRAGKARVQGARA